MINSQFALACATIGLILFLAGTSLEIKILWIPAMFAFIFGLYGIFAS